MRRELGHIVNTNVTLGLDTQVDVHVEVQQSAGGDTEWASQAGDNVRDNIGLEAGNTVDRQSIWSTWLAHDWAISWHILTDAIKSGLDIGLELDQDILGGSGGSVKDADIDVGIDRQRSRESGEGEGGNSSELSEQHDD
jgi:hypothetical protein